MIIAGFILLSAQVGRWLWGGGGGDSEDKATWMTEPGFGSAGSEKWYLLQGRNKKNFENLKNLTSVKS